jgi:methylenetetrahydrofolate dehydrogenase (NADP+) / methenyltetrahydrofolate cyclohydrolase
VSAALIDGKAVAARQRGDVAARVAEFERSFGRPPGLATVLVGNDPASAVYVDSKRKACRETGIASFPEQLPAGVEEPELLTLIDGLNADPRVDGILCQLPLPAQLDETSVTDRIDPAKDVDGLTPISAGLLAVGRPGLRPCTPSGVMRLLDAAGIDPAGKTATVIGRSNLFGKPMGQLLLAADATVTHCHRHTVDLAGACRGAEILIAAAGRPGLVKGEWIRPGATVIDVGINRTAEGLVGDVEFEAAARVASRITPVPGGVGPMTIAGLLENTLQAAWARELSGTVEPVAEGR